MAIDLTKIGAPGGEPPQDFLEALRDFAHTGVGLPGGGMKYDNTSGFVGRPPAGYPHGLTFDRSIPLNIGQAERLPGDWGIK